MLWKEILVKTDIKNLDRVLGILQMVSPSGLYIEDYSDMDRIVSDAAWIGLVDDELLKKDRSIGTIHLYITFDKDSYLQVISFIKERLKAEKIPAEIGENSVDDEDWANSWKKYFKPFKIGERIIIKPEWEKDDPQWDKRYILKIDPGMAFGTGSHPTTKLCILLLEKYTAHTTKSVLDVGTGSGILSIAAILLGAAYAMGIDADEYAIKTARENTALNCVADKVSLRVGDLICGVDGEYDVVCANIVADAIIKLSEDVSRVLAPNGVFISSGIIDTREEDVKKELSRHGFSIIEVLREECWLAIAASRPQSPGVKKSFP